MTGNDDQMQPITEDDIANYLANSPDFFSRHAELLAAVQLSSPHGRRAVSLQERQAEMLREKIKGLEHRIMEMVRHANENMVITDRINRWARSLLMVQCRRVLPATLVAELQGHFMVPQVALKLWDVDEPYAQEPFAQGVSEEVKSFAGSLTQPYCGVNSGLEPVGWLQDSTTVMSLALLPLRPGALQGAGKAFGLLVLGSPDPRRFEAGMATDLLERIAELASAALTRLRPR